MIGAVHVGDWGFRKDPQLETIAREVWFQMTGGKGAMCLGSKKSGPVLQKRGGMGSKMCVGKRGVRGVDAGVLGGKAPDHRRPKAGGSCNTNLTLRKTRTDVRLTF